MNAAAGPHQEIIIVKRGGEHEDGHHGGVWKIAFADFMTALMCFFLVMWLINAANEETKVSVASYFNPIKLVDRNSSRKGLEDIGAGPQSHEAPSESADTSSEQPAKAEATAAATEAKKKSDEGAKAETKSDQHLFSDPYAVLAEIAAETGDAQNVSAKGDGGAQAGGPATGASGGESYRDPFAPDFWSKQIEPPETMETDPFNQPPKLEPLQQTLDGVAEAQPRPMPGTSMDAEEILPDAFSPPPPVEETQAMLDGEVGPVDSTAAPGEGRKASGDEEAGDRKPGPSQAAIEAAAEINEELKKLFGVSDKIAEGISVTPTPDGVVISLTDQLDFGMFEIGSAVPRRDLVLAMEKVAGILAGRKGRIGINGHTDGRPFRSDNYDNWRLSTARAHSAYYMLVRAGLDERRVVEVAGFADRKLKVPAEPFDDSNRRIEILLETDG